MEVETGRYVGTLRENRFCTVYRQGKIEDEYHFLYSCRPLQLECSAFHVANIENFAESILLPDVVKTKLLLLPEIVKLMGVFLERMLKKRREILHTVD